jgi:hypothetical protein
MRRSAARSARSPPTTWSGFFERARYAGAALQRLRDLLDFAASAGRENESRPVATSGAPRGGGSDVIDLDDRRRNRAERAR